jgi:hypothetical protein
MLRIAAGLIPWTLDRRGQPVLSTAATSVQQTSDLPSRKHELIVRPGSIGLQRVQLALLIFILCLGATLRLYNLGTPHLTEDEGYFGVIAPQWAETGLPLTPVGEIYTRGVPLIALEALTLRFLPVGLELGVRLPTALLGILNIWLVFLLGRRHGGFAIGAAAACVFAISPWAIWIGTMARMYELLATSTLLSVLAYDRFIEARTLWRLALLAVALCLAVMSHESGVLLISLPLAGILVHFRALRTAAWLGVAAAWQLAFYFNVYPAALEWLAPAAPDAGEAAAVAAASAAAVEASDPPNRFVDMFIAPSFGLEGLESHLAWVAVYAGAAVVLACAIYLLVRLHLPRKQLVIVAPWLALVFAFGAIGALLMAGLALAVYFVFSSAWAQPPAVIRAHRIIAVGIFSATLFLWVLLAGLSAFEHGSFEPSKAWMMLAPTIRYPELAYDVAIPLLREPRTVVLFHAGVFGCALILLHSLRGRPILAGHPSLTARIVFMLGAVCAIGMISSLYRADRYLYFLFPVALVSALECARVCWRGTAPPVRTALAAGGILVVAASELPMAVAQLPDRDGRRQQPSHVSWLPDYLGIQASFEDARSRRTLDYRAASAVLRADWRETDLVMIDAAHQFQAYLPGVTIHAHLSPPLGEYSSGATHYFTGSTLLRTPDDLIGFLTERRGIEGRRVWVVLTGYDSVWEETLPKQLSRNEVWDNGGIRIYSVPAEELLEVAREGNGESTRHE